MKVSSVHADDLEILEPLRWSRSKCIRISMRLSSETLMLDDRLTMLVETTSKIIFDDTSDDEVRMLEFRMWNLRRKPI